MLILRRWLKNNATVDAYKIICWEQPNFAYHMPDELDQVFQREVMGYWRLFWLRALDLNRTMRLCYRKPAE